MAVTFRAVKCSCGKTWCSQCGLRKLQKSVYDHVSAWDWRKVRFITLTVDPKFFDSPDQCYDQLQKRKAVSNLIHNLKRTAGKDILDWHWVVEWHRNGFPHWHILIHVSSSGASGQIGQEFLHQYWPYGRIHESYFSTEKKYRDVVGYFGKHGYFEKGKKHQIILPSWARDRRSVVRRHGRQVSRKSREDKVSKLSSSAYIREKTEPPEKGKEWDEWYRRRIEKICLYFDRQSDILFGPTQGERLDKCGSATDVWGGLLGFNNVDFIGRFQIPYNVFKLQFPGKYLSGLGYVFQVPSEEHLFNSLNFN